MPQFQEVFASFNTPLPLLTQQVIALSQFLTQYGWYTFGLVIIITVVCYYLIRHFDYAQRLAQQLLLTFPILGDLVNGNQLCVVCTILQLGERSNIPLLASIDLAQQATPYIHFQQQLRTTHKQLQAGHSLAEIWHKQRLLSPENLAIITTAENTGKLETAFDALASHFAESTQHQLEILCKLLEPAVMIILSIIAGTLIIALYLPIFNIGAAMQ